MIIIGITGTLGAGKGTVVEYLIEKYGFAHYSAREFISQEIVGRGLPVNRDTMTEVSNDMRAKNNPGYIIEQLALQAKHTGKNAVIESVRTVGEIDLLKKNKSFHLFAVDADQKVRYERITERKSHTDNVSFEKFIEDEEREMNSEDPNKQNIAACIQRADYLFLNNGTKEDLQKQVDTVVKEIV